MEYPVTHFPEKNQVPKRYQPKKRRKKKTTTKKQKNFFLQELFATTVSSPTAVWCPTRAGFSLSPAVSDQVSPAPLSSRNQQPSHRRLNKKKQKT